MFDSSRHRRPEADLSPISRRPGGLQFLTASDYSRAARYLIGRYGAEADYRAAVRAQALHAHGHASVGQIWHALSAAVAEMARAGAD
jgi:hypothetical protein